MISDGPLFLVFVLLHLAVFFIFVRRSFAEAYEIECKTRDRALADLDARTGRDRTTEIMAAEAEPDDESEIEATVERDLTYVQAKMSRPMTADERTRFRQHRRDDLLARRR